MLGIRPFTLKKLVLGILSVLEAMELNWHSGDKSCMLRMKPINAHTVLSLYSKQN